MRWLALGFAVALVAAAPAHAAIVTDVVMEGDQGPIPRARYR